MYNNTNNNSLFNRFLIEKKILIFILIFYLDI